MKFVNEINEHVFQQVTLIHNCQKTSLLMCSGVSYMHQQPNTNFIYVLHPNTNTQA